MVIKNNRADLIKKIIIKCYLKSNSKIQVEKLIKT